ncbi:hypothetical protein SRABI118_04132 [Massilia sp. Bi118]|uniref:hypothetical protein n=1 Tax=Massilia sp. Bi118 TaxID=2822346 RepID=UPI001D6EC828|nr:hypothetical protein [Massilia sp. Bi118]CAH0292911.1 hypothetical protein SRABI118_04132 [Massilia sp. Bi118]
MVESAGAAGFPNRNRAALALIFGMHMLALFVWMRQRPLPLPDAPHVVSILLRPAVPQARPKPPEPVESGYPRPRRTHLPPIQDFFDFPAPAPAKPGAESAAATAVAPVTPAPPTPDPTPSLDDARAPATVQDAIREQKQAEGGFGLNLSKRQAGRIDRELRKGKSGIPDEPDTPMGRFRRGLEAAHVDRSNAVFEDSYTSPDGTIIYRKRIGKGAICRRSGSINPLGMNGMAMGNQVKENVPCPSGVDWKKD